MQKMQPPVQRLQPWMKRLQVWSQGYKSEEKGIKVIIFCRKDDFPSLFRGKLANFVRVFNYNKVQLI